MHIDSKNLIDFFINNHKNILFVNLDKENLILLCNDKRLILKVNEQPEAFVYIFENANITTPMEILEDYRNTMKEFLTFKNYKVSINRFGIVLTLNFINRIKRKGKYNINQPGYQIDLTILK